MSEKIFIFLLFWALSICISSKAAQELPVQNPIRLFNAQELGVCLMADAIRLNRPDDVYSTFEHYFKTHLFSHEDRANAREESDQIASAVKKNLRDLKYPDPTIANKAGQLFAALLQKSIKTPVQYWADSIVSHAIRAKKGTSSIDISPDSNFLLMKGVAIKDMQNYIALFDVTKRRIIWRHKSHHILAVAFSPNGNEIACREGELITVRDLVTYCPKKDIYLSSFACSMAYSPDGKLLVYALRDGRIEILDLDILKERREYRTAEKRNMKVLFSPDGKNIAAWNRATINVWNISTDQAKNIDEPKGAIQSVVFVGNGDLIAYATDKSIVVWNIQKDEKIELIECDDTIITALSAYANLLAFATADKTIRLWDLSSGRELKKISNCSRLKITSMVFAAAGKILATSSLDYIIRLWATGVIGYDCCSSCLLHNANFSIKKIELVDRTGAVSRAEPRLESTAPGETFVWKIPSVNVSNGPYVLAIEAEDGKYYWDIDSIEEKFGDEFMLIKGKLKTGHDCVHLRQLDESSESYNAKFVPLDKDE